MTPKNIYLIVCFISALASAIQVFRSAKDFFAGNFFHEDDDAPTSRFTTWMSPTSGTALQQPPRVLLGILSHLEMEDESNQEGKLRVILRRTYLSFDSVHNTTTPNRVCSLQEFLTKSVEDWRPNECQLVYTFVFGGNETRSATPPSEWLSLLRSSNQPLEIQGDSKSVEFLRNEQNETDYLFLNTGDRYHHYKQWSWYQYVASQPWKDNFDYIGHTDCKVRVHPMEFWSNSIFGRPTRGVYAGYQVEKTSCFSRKSSKIQLCPSLQLPSMMQRFSLVSSDVLKHVIAADTATSYGSVQPNESIDVALANTLVSFPKPLQHVPLEGVSPVLPNQESWREYLKLWDKYKDSKVLAKGGYEDPHEVAFVRASNATKYFDSGSATESKFSGPRVLMGIFTMDSPSEKERRAALRNTYLSFYKETETPHRICSLQEILKGAIPNNGSDCQMAYTFVMGGNPSGPTQLMEPNASLPLEVPESQLSGLPTDKDDILFLNIRENMEDGKSQTWLKYASTVSQDRYYFDYVGKTDTDTLIFPNYFLDLTLAKFPSFPNNIRVYGGHHRLKYEWARRHVGPIYMAGQLYWMSADLARFVASPTLDRRSVDWGVEDFSMGNFVHSHPLPIQRKAIVGNKSHRHPLKKVDDLLDAWTKFQKEEQVLLKRTS